MKEIPLTQRKVALVDDADFEEISRHKWYARRCGKAYYAVRAAQMGDRRVYLYMHRVVMEALPGMEIDHINSNTLDNQRSNLRACTRSQNHMNARKLTGCSSRYKGVYWNKQARRWHSRIKVNGKHQHLGHFDNEWQAACTYNQAASRLFGEFASLNPQAG